MTAVELLALLNKQGITLFVDGGDLRISAPKGSLTDELVAGLRTHKAELIELLAGTAADSDSSPKPAGITPASAAPVLSFAQERLWFLDQLDPGSALYNIPTALRLQGAVNRAALQEAVNRLVQRHASLRTVFSLAGREAVIDVRGELELPVIHTDMVNLSGAALDTELRRLSNEPFDLAAGPLLRVHLLSAGARDHILLIVMHHIVSDGWSLGIFMRELAALYAGDALPPLPVQYSDYAAWQRATLSGVELERELGYWREQLTGSPAVLELPADRPRPAKPSQQGAWAHELFPVALLKSLEQLARDGGQTLYMVLLAAFKVLLYRHTRQDDIVVGTPVAGRQYTETEGLIGLFVNSVIIRSRLDDEMTFREFLQLVQDSSLDALEHQALPFEKLVEELQPDRDQSYAPLFQVMFNLQSREQELVPFSGLEVSPVVVEPGTAKFDLNVLMEDRDDGLAAWFEYSTDLYDRPTIERMLGQFRKLLEAIAARPDTKLAALPLLDSAERERVLTDWNQTGVDYPKNLTLIDLFEAQVAKTPDAIAVSCGAENLSYAQLNARANQLGYHLGDLGIGPEDLVGVCTERSLEMVIALYGILKAGAAYVPLDPEYPQQRLAHMLEDARISVLLSQSHLSATLPENSARVINLDTGLDTAALAKCATGNPAAIASARDAAYVIFTSGSTGRPKGVLNEHRGICNRLLWMQDEYGLTADDRVLQKTPFSFDVSVWEFFWPLITGARLIVAEPGGHRDTAYLAQLIQDQQITTLHFVPSMLASFLQAPAAGECTSVKRVICSGEALSADLQERLFDTLPAELHNLYGPTEAAIDVTYWACDRDQPRSTVPIGRPVANTQIYIVDSQGQPTPVGVPGELWIGGVQVARGYVNQPELTSEKFIVNPFSAKAGERVYRTGDLARFSADGVIEFLGRIDFQVKLRGFRIELGEIEAELQRCDSVEQSVVLLREDSPGDQRLAAYITGDFDTEALRSALTARLPDYMVPAAFVSIDTLPLTPNGKLDRGALPAPDWGATSDTEYLAPRTPVEEALAEIWQALLGVQQVGVYDDFFRLGGHSLLATRLVARIRDTLNKDLPLRSLFDTPTVAGLASYLESAAGTELTPIGKRVTQGTAPLSASQQRLWILDQMEPGNPVYNIPWAARLAGQPDTGALQAAIDSLLARHESLRTCFVVEGEGPAQKICAELDVKLQQHSLPDAGRDEILSELTRLSQHPFALDRGPLLRVNLLKLKPDEHILHIVVHHIVSDAWSTGVLLRDLASLYNAALAEKEAALPELPVQFPDYAEWQAGRFDDADILASIDYWKQQLAGAPAVLDLPTDRPRPAIQTYSGAWHKLRLPADLSNRIRELAGDNSATLYMVLLAAFQLLLNRYSGQTDIVVGSPIAGRLQHELENLIGFFINTLALRADLDGNPKFTELLEQVKETALDAYGNQELPFERLVEELQPVRDTSYAPVFQVMFILQNAPAIFPAFDALECRQELFEFGTAKLDLTLSMEEQDGELVAYFEYNTDLFDAGSIERMAVHFAALLEGIVAQPDKAIGEYELLTAAERQTLVSDWNRTEVSYDRNATLHSLFEQRATETGEAIAVECDTEKLSYAELDARANRLAHRLIEAGSGKDLPVALCVERSPDMLVALLGILKSGSAYVPLDPGFPPDRLRYMLEDSGAKVLVTESGRTGLNEGLDVQTICLDVADPDAARPTSTPSVPADGSQLAYIIYTSGSTGNPKGVAIEHGAAVNFLLSMIAEPGISESERLLAVTTLSFDISVLELFGPLLTGGTVVLASRPVAADGFALARLLEQGDISMMQATPATWRMLLQTGWRGMQGLKILCGGEALDIELARQLAGCGGELWNMYGPTETTIWSTCSRPSAEDTIVTVGTPIANTRCYILDAQRNPVPAGVAGELFIGGDGVARGYLNRAELNAEKFIADPFAGNGARMYSTGDLARYLADGRIEVLGRTDFQVKLRGFRIELGEIEAALAELEQVSQCVTMLREDKPGDQRLVAYFTMTGTSEPGAEELRTHLRNALPEYMIPAAFMRLGEFPLTPNGKVDRKQLPAPEWTAVQEYVAPRNDTEAELATIWAEILEVEQVGMYDDFFMLGGHSLLATRLISRILDTLGIELPLMALFNRRTVAGLAEELSALRGGVAAAAIPHQPRDGDLPLSFAQQRLWFLDELSPGDPMYNIPWVMSLHGEPNRDALQGALDQVIARHESLRTIFPNNEGEPQQIILQQLYVAIREEDLRGATDDAVQERITELAQERMSLANGPLIYVTLLRTGDDDYLLTLIVHHIVFDAWSHGVLLKEMSAYYNAALRKEKVELAPLEVEFADYAVWQRDWFGSDDFKHQLTYWKNQLGDAPTTLELPTDHPRPPVQTSNGANISRMLSADLRDGINALTEAEGCSLFMTLLAAFNVLMSRYSGQDDLLVGTPISGRKRTELEKIVGFFLHTLVIRADLEGNPGFREFLGRTRQTVLEAFAHQEMPFETLVEALDPERDTSRHPLFQVHFVLQHVDIDWEMFDGLSAGPVEFEFGTAKFDIMFFVFDTNDSLSVRLEYNTDLFETETIERMIDHFETLLTGIIESPDRSIGELPLLPQEECRKLLVDWNQTGFDYPAGGTMHGYFERQVNKQPDAIAMLADGTDYSYRELNRRANKLAAELQKLGVGPEILVAVCSERCAELVTSLFAVQKAGGAYVPVDPDYPPQRVAHMLTDSEAPVLLTQTSLLDRMPEHSAQVICLDTFDWDTDATHDANPVSGVGPDNLGYTIYTSGSTGLPKGVEIEHGNAVALIEWAGQVFAPAEFEGVLASTSVCFDLSVYEIFCPLGLGGRIILVKDALALPELDDSANITLINTVPSAMAELVRIKGVPDTVKTVNLAGEPLSTALVNSIYEPGTVERVNDLYGPSEDTTYSTWTLRKANALPSIGRPVYNTQAYLLDRFGEPVPTGVPGELYLGGEGVTRGYRNRPELTASRYLADPFSGEPGARMYRTGDQVRYRSGGEIEFIGRLDHQVKLRGFRIELGEIETALASHSAVENTVVMAREDREGDKRLVAYIVASTEGLEGEELEQWESEQVSQWQDLWQDAYSQSGDIEDLAYDFRGWNSSYSGDAIPAEEMHAWLNDTRDRILELKPRRVLEIGSGTGLIAAQVVPEVDDYTATDFSDASIAALEKLRDSQVKYACLQTARGAADEISTLGNGNYDTIILNSVAQYFPDIDYLRNFVKKAATRLPDGGHIFLGDLRSMPLLEAYHTSVQLFQAEHDLPLRDLAENIRQRTEQEEELLVDPAFFIALQKDMPEICGVRFELKRSRFRNELTRFRYDVVLLVNTGLPRQPEPQHLDWNSAGLTLDILSGQLAAPDAADLLITGIPDARLAPAKYALEKLEFAAEGSAGELRAAEPANAVEPEDLFLLAEQHGLDVQICGVLPGEITALYRQAGRGFDGALMHAPRPVPWRDYGNDPLQGRLQRSLVPILRERLIEEVPEYMVPSAFVILDAFPLTPNGKVNRKALPAPERKRSEQEIYVAPRTETEEQLVAIWSDVLGVKQIGVHDDFFALGGHSLLATQLISRIRDSLNTELPLLALFNHPTVAGLAVEITGDEAAVASAIIQPVDRGDTIPLSFAQQRLWFLDQLEGVSSTYNVPLALALDGPLNIDALQATVDTLVARHESLRTSFATTQGVAMQVISDELHVPVDVVDLKDANDAEVQVRLEELAQTPFNLSRDALLRVHVLQSGKDRQILLLVMHHIVSDGWSLGILARELAALYAGHCGGMAAELPDLPDLPIQYADFAIWQRGWLAGEELRRQLSYWEEQLDDAPALLALPTDRPRQSVQTFNGAHINLTLSRELGDRIRELAGAEDATLFMTLLAAFNTLLARYTGTDDIVVGTPIAGRNRTEIEGLVGFFVNTLAMRTDMSGDPDFIEVLRRVRRTALGAYAHQEIPFEKLVEELQPDRDTSHPPLFQVLFVLQENLSDHIAFHELEVTPLDFELGSSKFDLSLFMVEFPEGLTASIEYNTDLFDAATIERLLQHFETLLRAIIANPAQPITQLPLLTSAERKLVIRDFNATHLATQTISVHGLVEQQAERTPDSPALCFGEASLTYRELNERANRLARHLAANGAVPGTLVGICAGRGIDTAVSVLAVLKSGTAYVPIDPNYPGERVQYMLEDSQAPVLITESGLAATLPEHKATTVCIDQFDWTSGDAANPGELGGESVYAIYTSGSTGRPKGVELTHAGLSNLIQWQNCQRGLDSPARTLQFASLSFDVSFQELFTTWAQGGTVVLIDEELRRDLAGLARFIATDNIERVYMPFAALQPLAECVTGDSGLEFAVRDVIVAGEQLQITPTVRAMFATLNNARLHNHYGPSEAHVVTAYTLGDDIDKWMPLPPIGKPVANTQAYILDSNCEPVPVGVPGELFLGGVQVGRGYIHRKALTAEKFLPDPFVENTGSKLARMYRTGDRVRYLPDGNIEYLGRTDDQVKWRGFRIEPGEIEATLNEHPSVQQAAVMLREDNPGDKRLVAYLVAAEDEVTDTGAVRDWLREQVPDYMVPSAFVTLDSMPLTPSGKVARRKLPVPDYADAAQLYVAPRTPVEEALVQIWSDVLDVGQVGIHDDFFELGGHSLLATQLLSRVRDALDVELPLVTLFNHPSIAALAADVEQAKGATPLEAIKVCDRSQPLPLSFAQQRLWFLDQLEPGNPVYNLPWAMRLDGPLNMQALQAAIDDLINRHDTLRTLFSVTMGKPQQCVLDKVSVPVESVDATGDDEAAIEKRLHNLSRIPFGLGQTPLMRVHVLHTGNQQHIILLVLHHIVSDGWSLGVLYQELVKLYAGHCLGEPVTLPALPVQYVDYSVWQHDWFRSAEQQRQLDYWTWRLEDAPAILDLPTDRPRGSTQTYNGSFIEQVLPDAIHSGLKDTARQENSTLFMVCLAAFNVLMARYSGQKDICIGTPVAGRRHSELEGLIGFFINTLVMRNTLEGDPDFAEFLASVKDTALEAYAHQELPFEKLVDEIQPVRDMSHAPLFQVAFIMQNTPWDQGASLHDLEISPIELDYGVAKFDLSLVMAERREGLLVHLEYNTDLYDRSTIDKLLGHFETLLLAIVSDKHMPVAELPLLTASEREQMLFEWNDTRVPFADDTCIHTLIERRTAEQPDAPAILFRDEVISFAELNRRANQVAHYLIGHGTDPDTIVGLCVERSVNLVTGLLGIMKAGAAYVPLDPNYPSERLEWMLEDSGAPLLITQAALLDQLPHTDARTICLDLDWPEIASHADGNPESQAGPEDLAYVIYTSGSTGKPKGVMIRHKGVCNLADAQARAFGLGPKDRMLQFASISFDASIFEIVMGLQVGAAMVLAPQDELLPGKPLLQTLDDKKVTAVTLPPTALSQLPAAELPLLQTVTVAGEACSPELVEQWGVNRRFFNLYGPTESTVWASFARCKPGDTVTIGKPITNARLYVLDENLQPVPVGVAGELCIGGEGLARGYLNREELSAEKFRADPFRDEPDARIYLTGDRVRFLPDGNIDFLGRIDHQVKVRGFRIELGEIETTLSAREDVREAVVLARGDGLQNERLVAYIIPQGGSQLSLGELRAHLKGSLPEFMIPAAFVVLNEFPLTPNGKVDRDALPEPDDKRLALEVEYVAPRDHAERVLAAIWKDLLNVEQVGIHDNFFELGGDSILSIQIIARAGQEDLRLTPKQLFEHQTISELAATAGTDRIITADQGNIAGTLPLTPIQSWFAERGLIQEYHFNQSQLFDCATEMDGRLLEQAFQAVLMHHDALRMRVTRASGDRELQQAPDSPGEILRTISVEALSGPQQAEHMLRLSNALQANFDLANGPLIKALLMQREPGVPDRLLIIVHHVAIDWVSWNILLEDLQTAYRQLLAGQAVELPLKTSSYMAWSERLQVYADSDAATSEAQYWLSLPWNGLKALPQDNTAGANIESSTRDVTLWLSQDETTQLLKDIPRLWRTQINDVLLTALTRAVKQWSGSSSIAVNLEGHGREDLFDDINLSRTVGWLTTLYPQLLTLDDNNPGENLKAIRQQLQEVPNRGIGYGILRYLGPAQTRDALAALPVPEICFNYLGQLDQVAGTNGPLQPCFDARGTELGPADGRPHLVDFAIAVTGGRLQLSVLYSENRYKAETVERLANRLLDELRGLISHCLSSTAMAWTPADFPLAQLTQTELDQLLADDPAADDLYGVTSLQHGMLFHSLFTGEHDVYFARFRWRLEGAIDIAAFERAWQQVIDRHTSLRTSFHWEGLGEPVQIVHHDVKAHLETEDWEGDTEATQEQKLDAFLAADQARRFDFTDPPLMRLTLIRLNAEDHHFIWSFHHAIIDGWSVPLVLKEVFAVYDAERNLTTIDLEPPRPFSDYIDWLGRQDKTAAEGFWRGLLTGFSAPTALPGARVQQLALTSTPEYEEILARIPAGTVSSLRRLAQDSRLTLNTVIQGIWALLLSRYSGDNDVVFGATTSGRPATMPGVGSMIGLFLNTLPVRARIEPQAELLAWLKELQVVQLEVRNYEFASLVEVQGWSDVPRGTPMFGSLLAFENYPDMETMWTDTESITIREVDGFDRTNFPLTLNVAVFDELQLRVVFDTRMFDTAGIQKLCSHFEALLDSIVAKPDQLLRELSLLTSTEQEELALWNRTGQDYPRAAAMHTAFEQQAADNPDAIAAECAGVTLTYAELDGRANQLAHRLLELGAGKNTPVGLCIDRSTDMLVGLLGILKSGSAYLPLDPDFPPDRLRYMLEDSGAPVLVCTRDKSELADRLPVTRVCLDDAGNGIEAQPVTAPDTDIESKQLAYVIYTSGSTGKPKGVTIEHQAAVNFLHSMAQTPGVDSTDRLLAVTTLSFDISILELFTPLSVGGTVVVATAEVLTDGFALARLLDDARITIMQATPATWRLLLEANWERTENIKVLCGGEALDLELAQRLALPGFPVWNMYGPTETTIWSSCEAIEHDAERISVGRPIANTTLYVLDEEGRQVPVGVSGELYIGGEGVARGYHERPELTAERFLPDPYGGATGARMYRTGDLARYLPDGRLIVLGRTDFQVKLRGYRIELGEIEAALAELEAITQAVVMLREDTPGDQRLVGYMTAVEGFEPDTQELSAYLRQSLPDYMVPATYMRLEQIPLTPNGKVDRKQLPVPEWSADQEYVAPRNGVEEELAQIWADILSVEQVGIHDDFFALGGHSLIAMKLVSRVLESMRVELPLDRIFESPTIAGLAGSVSESRERGEEVPGIKRIERSSRRRRKKD